MQYESAVLQLLALRRSRVVMMMMIVSGALQGMSRRVQ